MYNGSEHNYSVIYFQPRTGQRVRWFGELCNYEAMDHVLAAQQDGLLPLLVPPAYSKAMREKFFNCEITIAPKTLKYVDYLEVLKN